MANSGWVRFQNPTMGVLCQVGINSGNVKGSPVPLPPAGGGNLFSAWVRDHAIDTDTVFYFVNHSGADVAMPVKWMAADGSLIQNTSVLVPVNSMVQVPASAYVG